MFTDIVDSTKRASAMGDRPWRDLLDAQNEVIRRELTRFRGREIKTLGDGMLATFDGPARAIRCALAVTEAVRPLGIEVRVGLHTGEVELVGDDVAGIAVHIAARVGALAGTGEVLVSGTVKDLVAGSGIAFSERGEHELKGVPDTVAALRGRSLMTTPWPSGVIDPHIHLWDPLTTRRHTSSMARVFRPLPRMSRAPCGGWRPRRTGSSSAHPHHVLKPYLPLDHRADAAEVPVATVVHIESDWLVHRAPRLGGGDPLGDHAPVRAGRRTRRSGRSSVHVDPRFDDAGDDPGRAPRGQPTRARRAVRRGPPSRPGRP